MQNVTTGVAMPSFRPLSTFSTRRTRTGRRSSAMTDALSAASVGARLAAISPARASGRLGNRTTATAVPATIDSGSPMASSRAVSGQVSPCRSGRHRGGVAEQQQGQRELGQRMDRGALDVDAADPPVGVGQQQPGDHEDERPGQVMAGEPVRQDRPPEDHGRQRDESALVHRPQSSRRSTSASVLARTIVVVVTAVRVAHGAI